MKLGSYTGKAVVSEEKTSVKLSTLLNKKLDVIRFLPPFESTNENVL